MLPSTLLGLVLFVVLLAPGLVGLLAREAKSHMGVGSPFREIARIVLLGVVADVVALGLFAVIHSIWVHSTPDVARLVQGDTDYAQSHYYVLMLWAIGMLTAACGVGFVLGRRIPLFGDVSIRSTWSAVFGDSHPLLGCQLVDGSYIEGRLRRYNRQIEETEDREILLEPPICYRCPGIPVVDLVPPDMKLTLISSRQIRFIVVRPEPMAGNA